MCKSLHGHTLSFILDKCPEMECPITMESVHKDFEKLLNFFPKWLCHFTLTPGVLWNLKILMRVKNKTKQNGVYVVGFIYMKPLENAY